MAIWVQLHHLLPELWEMESLDNLRSLLYRVLKIDDYILNVDVPLMNVGRAKYARLCIELDLSKPLQRGLWVGEGEEQTLVAILYERLPSFYFRYGHIGHILSSCTLGPSNPAAARQMISSLVDGHRDDL